MKTHITGIFLSLFFIISCSNEDNKIISSNPLRPNTPIENSWIQIGNQIWMKENLNVTKYRNGDVIPEVQDQTEWNNLTTGAWCYYANSTSNGKIYGKLYNWYAVNDPRGLAPEGYHIPTNIEFNTLGTFLGGMSIAGGKMKTTGTSHWLSPNLAATNSSGFSGLPGGARGDIYRFVNNYAYFWTSTSIDLEHSWMNGLDYNGAYLYSSNIFVKNNGFSVRCIKN